MMIDIVFCQGYSYSGKQTAPFEQKSYRVVHSGNFTLIFILSYVIRAQPRVISTGRMDKRHFAISYVNANLGPYNWMENLHVASQVTRRLNYIIRFLLCYTTFYRNEAILIQSGLCLLHSAYFCLHHYSLKWYLQQNTDTCLHVLGLKFNAIFASPSAGEPISIYLQSSRYGAFEKNLNFTRSLVSRTVTSQSP